MVGQDADGGTSRVQEACGRRDTGRSRRRDLDVGSLGAWSRALDEQRRELLAGVGHELKTPLSIVLGLAARLLGDDRLVADQREDVERVRANAYVLLKRVEDVLAVARLDSGAVELVLRDVDVAALVRESCEGFASIAQLRGQRLVVELPERLSARIDEDRILSIVSNLLANAFKHAPAGGVVRCTVTAEGGRLQLEVADSGPGVAEGMRAEIFERYRQGAGSVGRPGGSGLGLSIVREVVALHGGQVVLRDAPEGGAAFLVDLPLVVGPDPVDSRTVIDVAERQRTTVERLRAQITAERRGATDAPPAEPVDAAVLVVSGDPQLGAYVHELVGQRYRVRHAGDALEAARRLSASRPDAVLFDAAIGAVALAALRRRLGEVPILAFAATLHDVSPLLDAGAQDCLVKPFAPEDLRARLAALVVRGRAAASRASLLGALEKAFHATSAPVAIVDADGRFVRVSRALCLLLEMDADELLQRTVDDLTHPVDLADVAASRRRVLGCGPVVDRGLWRLMRGDGSFVRMQVSASLADEGAGLLLWELTEAAGETSAAEGIDALSIARGRRSFERAVHDQLLRCRRDGEQAALVRCTLDDLPQVRTRHGHEVAERLMEQILDAARRRLRDTDELGRLGANEIAAIVVHAGPEVQRETALAIRAAAESQRVQAADVLVGTAAVAGVASLEGTETVGHAFLAAGCRLGVAPRRPLLRLEAVDQRVRYVPGRIGEPAVD
ncbi:MAG: hypothetical protein QOC78_3551 [Solirubrobacteraceae bacterium]|jgi:diguanylate cyclase (GGDEF)-like protein/PAS domain S-box-containing protein|nr:hypothetical protein [Solirubrobacteraceae bacterium]